MHPPPPSEASLARRYGMKLFSNVATIPLFFLQEAILPRVLGPAVYGQYNFVLALFTQISTLFDPGVSTCMRTGLAKRPQEYRLLAFFARFALVLVVLSLATAGILMLPGLREVFLPGIPLWMVLPTAFCALLMWGATSARGINDALGVTHVSEIVRVGLNLVAALALVLLFFTQALSLPVYLALQLCLYSTLLVGFLEVFKRQWRKHFACVTQGERKAAPYGLALSAEQKHAYCKEFIRYCRPLLVIALCSAVALSAERWILQYFSGSVAQGYFSLSQRISMACFLFVTAMTPLFMRELAVAHHKGDTAGMARLMNSLAPLLYAVAAWFSVFTALEARAAIAMFGGGSFVEALIPVQIMALYPLHQTYGQITASVFYATGETRAFRTLSLISLGVGLLCTWFFVAPASLGGLSLGASGLAWKMIGVQCVTVLAMLVACRRFVNFSLGRNLLHQALCPLLFALLAWAARFVTSTGGAALESIPRFILSGVVYSILTVALVLICPFILGATRLEMTSQMRRVFAFAKGFVRW